ncbi:twin-arginine translocase TatA/TatE family subunit [Rhodobacteraceae bacterium RKSG542]|uniref:twin-arginine translocase TatA/TatE family subunit n=1 Tax=Pseudovibrio flavus TaxID=2529854 RepID=UPI0012BC0F68|nr:twin-arginine translocase TatA/TatE family subunit [Pseudovibrio flavus]MTI15862.1 twin-arginine translocase TatA/TatE family subunit [Pseudovibrio flavus]
MGSIGIWQIVIIAVVVVLLFGRGKISELMGDVAKGINSFKKGLKEEGEASEEKAKEDPKVIDHKPAETVSASETAEKADKQS